MIMVVVDAKMDAWRSGIGRGNYTPNLVDMPQGLT